jgi:signal peptidase I
MGTSITLERRAIGALLLVLLVLLAALVALVLGSQLLGRQSYVISGRSMEPALPIGSLVIVEPVAIDQIQPGDIVSVQALNGTVYTHRVSAVTTLNGEPAVQTWGDANPAPDPTPAPAAALIGRVVFFVPVVGLIVAMLSSSTGIVSIASAFACLLVLYWLAEDLEQEALAKRRRARLVRATFAGQQESGATAATALEGGTAASAR